MKILGIDPGLERLGYGVIEKQGSSIRPVTYGLIETPRVEIPLRLLQIGDEMKALLTENEPDLVVMEKLVFAANKTTALDVSQAIGVVTYELAKTGKPLLRLSPAEIKQSVVGVGNADKKQVGFMVQRLLGLTSLPKPDDVSDALAVAIAGSFRMNLIQK